MAYSRYSFSLVLVLCAVWPPPGMLGVFNVGMSPPVLYALYEKARGRK